MKLLPFSRALEVFVVSGPLKNCSGKKHKQARTRPHVSVYMLRTQNERSNVGRHLRLRNVEDPRVVNQGKGEEGECMTTRRRVREGGWTYGGVTEV